VPSGDVVFIEGEAGGRFPDANSLFIDDGVPTIIDPATRPADLERYNRESGVGMIINTHYHVDHTRYNRLFPDAELVAHAADAPGIESLDGQARLVGMEGHPGEMAWRKGLRELFGFSPMPVSRTVTGGEEISLGKNTIRLVHTPGHTPGHLCVQFLEKKAVYLADIDLTRFGPWYANLYSDIDDFLESIERVRALDAQLWYTAHEEGVIQGDITGRLDGYAQVIHDRDRRLLEFLSVERTLPGIIDAAIIYRKRWEPDLMFKFFEGMMVEKHLERLERNGLVTSDGDRWVRK
jgi:glyoxylase-like metal-dependent hydrolase (beta-lactamase superfamily II)